MIHCYIRYHLTDNYSTKSKKKKKVAFEQGLVRSGNNNAVTAIQGEQLRVEERGRLPVESH